MEQVPAPVLLSKLISSGISSIFLELFFLQIRIGVWTATATLVYFSGAVFSRIGFVGVWTAEPSIFLENLDLDCGHWSILTSTRLHSLPERHRGTPQPVRSDYFSIIDSVDPLECQLHLHIKREISHSI